MGSATQIQLKNPYTGKEWGKIVFEGNWATDDNGKKVYKEIQVIDIPPYIENARNPIEKIGITVLDRKENIPLSIKFKKGGPLSNGDYTAQLKVPKKWITRGYNENQIMDFLGNILRTYFRKNGVETI